WGRLPARARILDDAVHDARHRSSRRRPAQGQARVPRPHCGQPDGTAATPSPRASRAAPGAAGDRRGRLSAAAGGVGAALERVIRTLPLPLRNRLAATILEAVGDVQARRALVAVAEAPDTWLTADEQPWA